MYRLYWHPWSSSCAPMAVLEELGVNFDLHEVDYDGGENLSAEYRRFQPLGLIPALVIDETRSMFESAAIILYLCDRHIEAGLAPSTEDDDRHLYLQWMFFFGGHDISVLQSVLSSGALYRVGGWSVRRQEPGDGDRAQTVAGN